MEGTAGWRWRMEGIWYHLGARLGSRALRLLVECEESATALARAGAERHRQFGMSAHESRVLSESVAAAETVPPPQCGAARFIPANDAEFPEHFWRLDHP